MHGCLGSNRFSHWPRSTTFTSKESEWNGKLGSIQFGNVFELARLVSERESPIATKAQKPWNGGRLPHARRDDLGGFEEGNRFELYAPKSSQDSAMPATKERIVASGRLPTLLR